MFLLLILFTKNTVHAMSIKKNILSVRLDNKASIITFTTKNSVAYEEFGIEPSNLHEESNTNEKADVCSNKPLYRYKINIQEFYNQHVKKYGNNNCDVIKKLHHGLLQSNIFSESRYIKGWVVSALTFCSIQQFVKGEKIEYLQKINDEQQDIKAQKELMRKPICEASANNKGEELSITKLTEKNEEVVKLNQQIETLQKKIKETEDQATQIQQENEEKDTKIKDFEVKIQENDKGFEELNKQKEVLEEVIEVTRTKINSIISREETMEETQTKIDCIIGQQEEISNELADIGNKIKMTNQKWSKTQKFSAGFTGFVSLILIMHAIAKYGNTIISFEQFLLDGLYNQYSYILQGLMTNWSALQVIIKGS